MNQSFSQRAETISAYAQPAQTDVLEYPHACMALDIEITEADSLTEALMRRLEPLMRSNKEDKNGPSACRSYDSKLAQEVSLRAERVANTNAALRAALATLQL